MELYSRTLGVIGLGNIGRIVADRARGLGMRVIAADPYTSAEVAAKLDVELVTLDELFARADAITVHVPKTKETTKLLGREAFAKMKRGVLVVNAPRGGTVDEAALLEALEAGQVAGAGLDVFEQEPPPKDHPLVLHPRVICTPHLGASTEQAQKNVSIAVAEQVRDFLLSGAIRNAVNVPSPQSNSRRSLRRGSCPPSLICVIKSEDPDAYVGTRTGRATTRARREDVAAARAGSARVGQQA